MRWSALSVRNAPSSASCSTSRGVVIAGCPQVRRQDPAIVERATLATRVIAAGIDDEAVEPRLEAIGVAESPDVAPASNDRLLDGVLRCVAVSQDAVGDREEPVIGRADQRLERLAVSALCPPHQIRSMRCQPRPA